MKRVYQLIVYLLAVIFLVLLLPVSLLHSWTITFFEAAKSGVAETVAAFIGVVKLEIELRKGIFASKARTLDEIVTELDGREARNTRDI